MEIIEFHCPNCGWQKAPEIRVGWVICPSCKQPLALGAKIEKTTSVAIERQKQIIADLGEKLEIARRDDLDIQDGIEQDLIEAKEFLKALQQK